MKKIAFCFICIDDLNKTKIWEKFFEGNMDRCNIYIHSKNRNDITENFTKKYQIQKHFHTAWGDIYGAIQALYTKALENDDYKFVLVSESNIPVKSFDYVYDYLTKNNKSYIAYQPHLAKNENEKGTLLQQYNRYVKNGERCTTFLNNLDISHWYFNNTWHLLNKKHAKLIAYDRKIIKYFKGCFAYDENYPLYILSLNKELNNIENINVHYVDWKNRVTRKNGGFSPKTFDKIMKTDIIEWLKPDYLFARKFAKTSDIDKYIYNIWDNIFDNSLFNEELQINNTNDKRNMINEILSKSNKIFGEYCESKKKLYIKKMRNNKNIADVKTSQILLNMGNESFGILPELSITGEILDMIHCDDNQKAMTIFEEKVKP